MITPEQITATLAAATLARQSYAVATAGNAFGGPRGIWLECTRCPQSQVIAGSAIEPWDQISDEDAASVFVRHGWTGRGPTLKAAKCPRCATLGCWPADVTVPAPVMRGRPVIYVPPPPELPEGLWERDGVLMCECRVCERAMPAECEPEDFDQDMAYCGGSPRCCP
jgi:hypothetical protein